MRTRRPVSSRASASVVVPVSTKIVMPSSISGTGRLGDAGLIAWGDAHTFVKGLVGLLAVGHGPAIDSPGMALHLEVA